MIATEQKPRRPLRVLLVRLSAIGDCLHAAPVASALRRAHPDAFIGWAVQEPAATLLRGYAGVDRFHLYPRRASGVAAHLEALRRFRRELRSSRYDAALDVQGLTKSGLVAWWSGARQRIGFRGGPAMGSRELNALFLNQRFAVGLNVSHVVDRNLALLSASGLLVGAASPVAEWHLPEYAEPAPLSFLEHHGLSDGRYAVVSPGTIWRTKRWPPHHFAAAVRRLGRDRGLPVVIAWAGEDERHAAEEIVAGAGDDCRVLLAPPTDLRELATLLRHATLFLGCDSGPAHLAAALDVPCVSVFGPTDPARNGPYGPRSAAVQLDPKLDCQPCWRRTCSRGDFACLERLDADRVVAECLVRLDTA
ncbi:MAG: glycosyltransferase family 9 protein [Holophagales bacterium]|nr:glycosyltransferase family 9 protein [Holophagales bacterium]MYG31600.1 glycosyltransferase family 9 protein [Holophagales bacterium]MYI78330.1 glycosyltransferase family 9 protein [Holophagales bacterium]